MPIVSDLVEETNDILDFSAFVRCSFGRFILIQFELLAETQFYVLFRFHMLKFEFDLKVIDSILPAVMKKNW